MSATRVAAFDPTLQTSDSWLNDICEELKWERDSNLAYHALRSALHTLRDCLHPEEAAELAAQLPLLIKGVFYEGWDPAGKPVRIHTVEEFLAPIVDAFRADGWVAPAAVARAVFTVVKRHISASEAAKVVAALPREVQTLWA